MRGGTNRRAGARDNEAPRIVGTYDKAQSFGFDRKALERIGRNPDSQHNPRRRRAQSARAGGGCGFRQLIERRRVSMTEREAETVCQRTVAKAMRAERLVMAGLVPAIHVFVETWMPGTMPRMTIYWMTATNHQVSP